MAYHRKTTPRPQRVRLAIDSEGHTVLLGPDGTPFAYRHLCQGPACAWTIDQPMREGHPTVNADGTSEIRWITVPFDARGRWCTEHGLIRWGVLPADHLVDQPDHDPQPEPPTLPLDAIGG